MFHIAYRINLNLVLTHLRLRSRVMIVIKLTPAMCHNVCQPFLHILYLETAFSYYRNKDCITERYLRTGSYAHSNYERKVALFIFKVV